MTEAAGARLYFDANVFIYAVEGNDEIADQLRALFGLLHRKADMAVTSELTLAEVLPKADSVRRRNYLELLSFSGIFDLRPVTRDILMETVSYRKIARVQPSGHMPKLPDAIHVVAAHHAGCGKMVSFDCALKLPVEMHRVTRHDLPQLIQELS